MKDRELDKFLKIYGDKICNDCPLMKRYKRRGEKST